MATLIALGRSDAPERVRDRLRPFGGERGRRRTVPFAAIVREAGAPRRELVQSLRAP